MDLKNTTLNELVRVLVFSDDKYALIYGLSFWLVKTNSK
jgi:hypothetical protein